MLEHRAVAERWLSAEPDDDIRRELSSLMDADDSELAQRFSSGLTFGTAGLRAAIGAGPSRMNRLVVRRAAAGLVDHLLATVPGAAERGILIACDARHKSADFALDTARVAAARGMRAHLIEGVTPTPVLAWNIPRFDVAAAVMVTASHNPREDNGYKVYLGHGAQIVPPDDEAIATRIDAVDAPTVVVPSPGVGDAQPAIETEIREVAPAEECPSAPELPVDAGDEPAPVPVEVHLPLELFDSL